MLYKSVNETVLHLHICCTKIACIPIATGQHFHIPGSWLWHTNVTITSYSHFESVDVHVIVTLCNWVCHAMQWKASRYVIESITWYVSVSPRAKINLYCMCFKVGDYCMIVCAHNRSDYLLFPAKIKVNLPFKADNMASRIDISAHVLTSFVATQFRSCDVLLGRLQLFRVCTCMQ